jgi:molecular chaperone DnaJ
MLRIPGAGAPVLNSARKGDMYIKVLLTVPSRLSEKERKCLADFATIEGATDSPQPVALSSVR